MFQGKHHFNPLELDGSYRTAGIIAVLIGGRTINYGVQQREQADAAVKMCLKKKEKKNSATLFV